MSWAAAYIGRTDLHCWGLVRAVLAGRGIALPAYGEVDARELHGVAEAVRTNAYVPPWRPVAPFPGGEQPFDVVLMRGWLRTADGQRRRGDIHTGIVTRKGCVMHTDMGYAVVEVPLSHVTIKGRLVGCFRHEGLVLDGKGGVRRGSI